MNKKVANQDKTRIIDKIYMAIAVLVLGVPSIIKMICYQCQIGDYASKPSVLGNISMFMLYISIFLYLISSLKYLRKNILNKRKCNIIENISFAIISIAALIVIVSMIFEIPLDVSN